jgi:hypothetical protein
MANISSETIGGDDPAGAMYLDLAPHTVRCDAAMAELRAENAELRADVAGLKDAIRSMAMDMRKLQDKVEHYPIEVAGDWHLNE